MFIRIKSNKSNSHSVLLVHGERIPGKKNPLLKIVKNFGVAKDTNHLEELKIQAEQYKTKLMNERPNYKTLKILANEDIRSCRSVNRGFNDIYAPIFASIFSQLQLKPAAIAKIQNLAIMRIAESCSKRRTAKIASEYGLDLNLETIYKTMDLLNDNKIENIKQIIYRNSINTLEQHNLNIDVLFYDLTTIYFENNNQSELKDFGFSKDGKHQHVQVMMALIVTRDGLPIGYELFPGNMYEGHTLIPVLTKLRDKYQINRVVLVADAALMNNVNLNELDRHEFEYVISARLKNSTEDIKQTALFDEDYKEIAQYDNGEEVDHILAKTIDAPQGRKLLCYYSSARARKNAYDREKALEKIKKYLDSSGKTKLTSALKKPYVKMEHKGQNNVILDEDAIAKDKAFDGYFALCTNIKNGCEKELLGYYRGLWQVEQSFRVMKHNLEIRPVFHYTQRRIKAHFALCYMAFCVIRQVEFKLKQSEIEMPMEKLNLALRKMRKVNIIDREGNGFEILEDPPPELVPVYQALCIKWPQKFKSTISM